MIINCPSLRPSRPRRPSATRGGFVACAMIALTVSGAGIAQSNRASTGREVVQALPNPDTQRLNRALLRLATNPRDVETLIEAGRASLAVDDIDGAIGFFGRADSLQPGHPRAKMGLASAYVRTRRPVEALRLFAEVDRQGVAMSEFAGDRGLAFDLVGDHASAQTQYREALRYADDPTVSRRLAISQAISGDRKGFEATLAPMLKTGDTVAFRTRAFGLAILGRQDEALGVLKTAMPPALASGLTPYLATMPRLSSAEQAAAVHLGVFPAQAASRPAPTVQAPQVAAAPASSAPRARPRREDRRQRGTDGSRAAPAEARAAPEPKPREAQPVTAARLRSAPTRNVPAAQRSEPAPTRVAAATPAARPVAVAATAPSAIRGELPALPTNRSGAAIAAAPEPAPVSSASPVPTNVPVPASAAAAPRTPLLDLDTAFADLSGPLPAPAVPAAGVVDITQLAVRRDRVPSKPVPAPVREAAPTPAKPAAKAITPPAKPDPKAAVKPGAKPSAKPPAKPKDVKPAEAHPARLWIQLAAGRDRSALQFDWKRLSRQSKGKIDKLGPFVAKWGQTNRLLVGPFKDEAARRAMVKTLEDAGLDTLPHSSSAGAVVEPLK